MDLSYSPKEQAFQNDVRDFLAAELPAELSQKVKARRELTED